MNALALLLGVRLWLGAQPSASPAPRPPAFELRALGVLGGDVDTNLSCFLLGRPGEPASLMIDGGSVVPGLIRWQEKEGHLGPRSTWSERTHAALSKLEPVRALLLTHAHLDHLGGFVQQSTLQLYLVEHGHPGFEVVGLPETLKAVRELAFHAPLWADFTQVPKDHPTLVMHPLPPGTQVAEGPFQVETVPLHHPVDSAAFLIHSGEQAYLHLGDTSASEEVWRAARPLLTQGRLHAVAVEVSFPSEDEHLAASTGHLTPASLLLELAKLAGLEPGSLPPADKLEREQALALARKLAPHFRDCPVLTIHIKAMKYEQVVAELKGLQQAGLNLIIPEQGEAYRF